MLDLEEMTAGTAEVKQEKSHEMLEEQEKILNEIEQERLIIKQMRASKEAQPGDFKNKD